MKRMTFYKFSELPKTRRHDCAVAVCGFLGWLDDEFLEEVNDIMNAHQFVMVEQAVDRIMDWNGLYYSYSADAVIQIKQEMADFRASETIC